MNQLFLADDEIRENLFPFTLTRSAADIRIGILTIREKWQAYLGAATVVPADPGYVPEGSMRISASIVPSGEFAASLFSAQSTSADPDWQSVKILQHPWHIFTWNDWAIRNDFVLITDGRESMPVPSTVQTIEPRKIFIEAGAKLNHCIINAEEGPVYIGKKAQIMEGAAIRGPVAICEGATVKMGAKIYGATTIGPYSIAGGEIKNSVLFGYSNKAHEGYLGDSVVGEWCNIGAGTSNSNLKNNAGQISMYSQAQKQFINTGLNKCGLIMGDYTRCAINTSFNTGTITGVCANIFGEGLTPKYIPSFGWGIKGTVKYAFDKALADINKWKKLKGHALSEEEKRRLKLIFDQN